MGPQSITHPPRRTCAPYRIAHLILLALGSLLSSFQQAPAQTTVSATTIPLLLPSAIVFDAQGNLYIAETANHDIRKVDTAGNITTIAGNTTQGFSGDNGPATTAQLDSPQGLALDATNNLYIADTHNQRIRKLSLTTGIITTLAGTGTAGSSGDNGPATSAQFNLPTALALNAAGDLYIADAANHRIREINAVTGQITTIAGNGTQGFSGDNGMAVAASIDSPTGIAIDAAANIYLADTHNHRIREIVATTGIITTIAGTGTAGYSGDNAAASAAALALPHGLTVDAAGNLYLADMENQRIRRIDTTTGIITTVVGNGTQGFSGDNDPAIAATLNTPRATVTSPSSLLTLADTGNQRIRQLESPGQATIQTIAGIGASTPGTLTLSAPSTTTYGIGQIAVTLTSTPATGTITFINLNNSTPATLGTVALAANTAALSIATLPVGVYNITATYAGDATHAPAQTTPFILNITPQPLTATIAPITLLYGQAIPQLTGTLTGELPQDAASLSVTFTTTAASLSPPGIYPITATIAGTAAGNYTLATTPAGLTITQAPTLPTLIASSATIAPGLPVTLTAHVASPTTGTPTGVIALLDNGSTFGSTVLSATGNAVFTTSTLAVGSHTLTAVYGGDANFTPATSAPAIIGVGTVSGAITNSDFSLAATGTPSQTIVSGTSASFTFAAEMLGTPLSSPIALAATGLPSLATASFNPAYLPPGASNTFTLTIATPSTMASKRIPTSPITFALLFFPIAGLTLRLRNRHKTATLLAFTLFTLALTLCTGCGDRIRTAALDASAAIPYTITVTGTATTPTGTILQHTTTVTLLLQSN